jgi:hypothetical protein
MLDYDSRSPTHVSVSAPILVRSPSQPSRLSFEMASASPKLPSSAPVHVTYRYSPGLSSSGKPSRLAPDGQPSDPTLRRDQDLSPEQHTSAYARPSAPTPGRSLRNDFSEEEDKSPVARPSAQMPRRARGTSPDDEATPAQETPHGITYGLDNSTSPPVLEGSPAELSPQPAVPTPVQDEGDANTHEDTPRPESSHRVTYQLVYSASPKSTPAEQSEDPQPQAPLPKATKPKKQRHENLLDQAIKNNRARLTSNTSSNNPPRGKTAVNPSFTYGHNPPTNGELIFPIPTGFSPHVSPPVDTTHLRVASQRGKLCMASIRRRGRSDIFARNMFWMLRLSWREILMMGRVRGRFRR